MSLRGSVGSVGADAPQPRARPPSPLAYEAPVTTAAGGASLYSDALSMQPELLARMRAAHVDSRAPRADAALTSARLAPPPAGRPRPVFESTGSIVAQVLGPAPLPMPARVETKTETETETSAPVGLGELGEPGEHDLHDEDTLEHAPTDTSYVSPSVSGRKDQQKAYDLYYTDEDNVPLVVAAWGREAPKAIDARFIDSYKTRVRTKPNMYSTEAFSTFAANVTTRGGALESEITDTALTNAQVADGGATPFNTAAVVAEPASMGFGMVGAPSLAKQELASILASGSTVRQELNPSTAKWENMSSPKTRPWLAPITNPKYVSESTQQHFTAMAVLSPYAESKKKVWIYAPKSGHGVDENNKPIKRNYLPDWEWSEISTKERCKLFGCRVVPLHVKPDDSLEYGHCIWIARREFWLNADGSSFGATGKAWKSACAQFPCHYIEMHLVSDNGTPYIALLNALALTAACLQPVPETAMPVVDAYRELGWYASYRTHQLSEDEADEAVKTAAAKAAALAEERGEEPPPPPPRPPTYTTKAIKGIEDEVKLVEGLPKDVSEKSFAAIYTPGQPHVSLAALWTATHLAHTLYNRRLGAKLGKVGIGALVANVLTTDQQVAKKCLPFDPKTKSKTTSERTAEGAKKAAEKVSKAAGKAYKAAGKAGAWVMSKMPPRKPTQVSCCEDGRAEWFDARALPQDDGADWSDSDMEADWSGEEPM
jgi:hypothetical protein